MEMTLTFDKKITADTYLRILGFDRIASSFCEDGEMTETWEEGSRRVTISTTGEMKIQGTVYAGEMRHFINRITEMEEML